MCTVNLKSTFLLDELDKKRYALIILIDCILYQCFIFTVIISSFHMSYSYYLPGDHPPYENT